MPTPRMTNGDNFEAYWTDEKDWLVEVVMLPTDEDCTEDLDFIGKLLAYSIVTNTRIVAQIGDPDPEIPVYELWFSFASEENKQAFLGLLREDGYANPDEETTLKPPLSLDRLAELRPLSAVFPENYVKQILLVELMTLRALQPDEKRASLNPRLLLDEGIEPEPVATLLSFCAIWLRSFCASVALWPLSNFARRAPKSIWLRSM